MQRQQPTIRRVREQKPSRVMLPAYNEADALPPMLEELALTFEQNAVRLSHYGCQ